MAEVLDTQKTTSTPPPVVDKGLGSFSHAALATVGTGLTWVLRACVLLFSACVFLSSAIFTVTYDYSEQGWAWRTSEMPFVIIGMLIVLGMLCLARTDWLEEHMPRRQLLRGTFLVALILSVAWVLVADPIQSWDSGDLLNMARIDTQFDHGDAWGYAPGSYMARYPYQAPITLVVRLLVLVAGSRADYVFCLLSAVMVAVAIRSVVAICYEMPQMPRRMPYVATMLCLTFLPLVFYATFVYGNVPSVALISLSAFLTARTMRLLSDADKADDHDGKKAIAFNGIASALCVGLAVALKSSSLVALVAYAVAWVIWAMMRRKAFPMLIVITAFLVNSITCGASVMFLEHMSGTDLSHGLPSVTWMAMGIGATSDEPMGSETAEHPGGMFDGWPWRIPDDEWTPERYSEESRQKISDRLDDFAENPDDAVRFFIRKFTYEWGDPLYGSLLSSNWERGDTYVLGEGVLLGQSMGSRELTPIARSTYYGKLNFVVRWGTDVMQVVLFLGALVSSILMMRRGESSNWLTLAMPCLYAAGGALLYVVWEAKSQYVLGFAFLLIPLAAYGLGIMTDRAREALASRSKTTGTREEDSH